MKRNRHSAKSADWQDHPGRFEADSNAEPRLEQIELMWDDNLPIPPEIDHYLTRADEVLQRYWDQWHRRPIEQYVACDFRDVWRALLAVQSGKLLDGNTFCEWGCGFGIVTGLASLMGLDAVGIEAEPFLVEQAKAFLTSNAVRCEILHGNFLPPGSERLAKSQANHACLFHQVSSAYEQHELRLDDYAMIFAYPWPGEHYFQQEVFRIYARTGAHLLMFLGPYEIELYRKTT